jgi:hypothetical protein
MSLDEISSKDLSSPNTTVIRTLRTWESHLGPSVNLTIGIKESVLLF